MRKSWDKTFMNIAVELSEMGTCGRRQVGCVLVDSSNEILSMGFNGVPPKWNHCRSFFENDDAIPCPGIGSKSGVNLDDCLANHAEANALMRCKDKSAIMTCYTTSSPCVSCIKMLLCTSTRRIVFNELYPHPQAEQLWLRHSMWMQHPLGSLISGPREWIQLVGNNSFKLGSSGKNS